MPRKITKALVLVRRNWSMENHTQNRTWFWSFTPCNGRLPKTWGSLRCTLYRRLESRLGNGCSSTPSHWWMNLGWCFFLTKCWGGSKCGAAMFGTPQQKRAVNVFLKKWSSFLGGIGYESAQQLTISTPLLVRIHDLKLMLKDNLAWHFLFSVPVRWLVFGGMIFFKPSLFLQWVVKSYLYHFLLELFLSELWVMSTHNDTHLDSKSWRFCCIGIHKKGLEESKSLATRWGFRYLCFFHP